MSAMSNYTEKKLGEHLLRGIASTSPGEVWLALYTSNPGEDNSGTECSYTGYARRSFGATPSAAFSAIGVDGKTSNQATLTFPANGSGGNVVVTHWAIFDASSGGNMLLYGALDASKTLEPTDVLSLPATNLEIEFA